MERLLTAGRQSSVNFGVQALKVSGTAVETGLMLFIHFFTAFVLEYSTQNPYGASWKQKDIDVKIIIG